MTKNEMMLKFAKSGLDPISRLYLELQAIEMSGPIWFGPPYTYGTV